MKRKVDVGNMANKGSNVILNRPGNTSAEKIRMFSSQNIDDSHGKIPVVSSNSKSGYQTINRNYGNTDEINGNKISNANQIDQNIFIGNSASARDIEWIESTGITNIVNTAAEIPNFYSNVVYPKLRYFNLRLEDNPQIGNEDLLKVLETSYRYITNVLKINPSAKILVHCHMGKSRSASIVIYYLMRSRGMSYEEALRYSRSKRDIIAPNRWYEEQLRDVDKLLNSNPSY